MKMAKVACILASTLSIMSGSAFAAPGVTPTDTPFIAQGGVVVVKNGPQADIWVCTMALFMTTGPSIGGTPARASGGQVLSGAMTAGANCPTSLQILPNGPVSYDITSANATDGTGVLHGFTVNENGATWCTTTDDVPFQWRNQTTGPSVIAFPTSTIGGGGNCKLTGNLSTGPDINVVP